MRTRGRAVTARLPHSRASAGWAERRCSRSSPPPALASRRPFAVRRHEATARGVRFRRAGAPAAKPTCYRLRADRTSEAGDSHSVSPDLMQPSSVIRPSSIAHPSAGLHGSTWTKGIPDAAAACSSSKESPMLAITLKSRLSNSCRFSLFIVQSPVLPCATANRRAQNRTVFVIQQGR